MERHSFLDLAWVGVYVYERNAQERTSCHAIDLQGVAMLLPGFSDETAEGGFEHLRRSKSKGSPGDGLGHVKEGPTARFKVGIEQPRGLIMGDRNPGTRTWIIFRLKILRAHRVPIHQNATRLDHDRVKGNPVAVSHVR